MQFTTAISILAIATTAISSAVPVAQRGATSDCVGDLLCCGSLTTPLDSTVDPLLETLGIDAASVVGSVGLDCTTYSKSCTSAPQCCTEANLLNGILALGCSDLK
ncbi:hypothetical protein BO94DRAFT_589891 [Aspergillus sclerotioniger CBS 115572]|uniref:Hydrophobin n=1 Tax=Aspergillus sclerotioniger CBS 115572 TaxID=1450535 RepID=A0A317VEE6_9EURO|nr:hypothetical protein BO94DRAFT_589891 [Aspergillus sclerotioniger CBS 115572]PWY71819.1 hypothetical protein BO94DRAFT_589891 [Aspergillus sclerotioniger CBS 115572]